MELTFGDVSVWLSPLVLIAGMAFVAIVSIIRAVVAE